MDRVREIIRMPETVKVPLTPHSLAGLANLRGRVLPVVSLRAGPATYPPRADEATRVIVVDCGVPLGFVVDRVAAVVSVEPERIDAADAVQSTVDSRILSGVIKQDGGELLGDPRCRARRRRRVSRSRTRAGRRRACERVLRPGVHGDRR